MVSTTSYLPTIYLREHYYRDTVVLAAIFKEELQMKIVLRK